MKGCVFDGVLSVTGNESRSASDSYAVSSRVWKRSLQSAAVGDLLIRGPVSSVSYDLSLSFLKFPYVDKCSKFLPLFARLLSLVFILLPAPWDVCFNLWPFILSLLWLCLLSYRCF